MRACNSLSPGRAAEDRCHSFSTLGGRSRGSNSWTTGPNGINRAGCRREQAPEETATYVCGLSDGHHCPQLAKPSCGSLPFRPCVHALILLAYESGCSSWREVLLLGCVSL